MPDDNQLDVVRFGDCLETLKTWSAQGVKVQTCVTSPPYFGLRDYGVPGQLGMEGTPQEYVQRMVEVFQAVRNVLREDGTLWLNLGDSYAGSWGNQGRKETRGEQRPIHGEMIQPVHDGRYPSKGSNTGKIPEGSGLKPKDLIGIPWRVALALQADGWYLRQDIIWHKPNPMPESVTDRCTKSHEYVFLLSKSARYLFDSQAMREPAVKGPAGSQFHTGKTGEHQLGRSSKKPRVDDTNRKALRTDIESRHRSSVPGGQSLMATPDGKRNRRSVWTISTKPYKGAHFATFPPDLVEPCVLAGSHQGDIVLDPFMGSGTTAMVAKRHGRHYLGCELNREYEALQTARIGGV